jgi:hypothetical protein
MSTSIDRIGGEPREPTVTENDLDEYQEDLDFNLTDYKSVAVTEEEGVYGSDRTLNGEVVETLTGEEVKDILSVSEEGNGHGQISTSVAAERFVAWDMPYAVGKEGNLQPIEGESTDAVYERPSDYGQVDVIE